MATAYVSDDLVSSLCSRIHFIMTETGEPILDQMPDYRYSPLPDAHRYIRLLQLQTTQEGQPATTPRYDLHTVCLDDTTIQYDALSYTWGSNTKTHDLLIEDCTLGITENLHQALAQLHETLYRPIWIDAVCISQDDDAERSAQVSQMRRIFSQAHHVTAWVGKDSKQGKCEDVFEFLSTLDWSIVEQKRDDREREFYERPHVNSLTGQRLWSRSAHNMRSGRSGSPTRQNVLYITSELVEFNQTRWAEELLTLPHLNEFLARPWFSRRWVIQEVIVAKTASLRCGPYSLPWKRLMHALNNSDYECHKAKSNVAALLCKERQWNDPNAEVRLGKGDILAAMVRFEHMACKDPRDRIGAILSLWPEIDFVMDYSASERDVFCAFARTLVDAGQLLQVLQCTHTCRTRDSLDDPSLPSWVPDLRRLGSASFADDKIRGEDWNSQGRVLSGHPWQKAALLKHKVVVTDELILKVYAVQMSRSTYGDSTSAYRQESGTGYTWTEGFEPPATSVLSKFAKDDSSFHMDYALYAILEPVGGRENVFTLFSVLNRSTSLLKPWPSYKLQWWNDLHDCVDEIWIV